MWWKPCSVSPSNPSKPAQKKSEEELKSDQTMKAILTAFINPIYFFLKYATCYTCTLGTMPTQVFFWHSFFLLLFRGPFLFYGTPSETVSRLSIRGFAYSLPLIPFASILIVFYMGEKVQTLENMKMGLLGALASNWILIGAILVSNTEFMVLTVIARCAYHVSIFSYLCCFLKSKCYQSNVYVELPNQPFSKFNFYVVIVGLAHIAAGILLAFLARNVTTPWIDCSIFFIVSFFLSCDVINVFSTNQYSLRKQIFYWWNYSKTDGIICHVLVRKFHKKPDLDLPEGYQYDDNVKIDEKWYNGMFIDY